MRVKARIILSFAACMSVLLFGAKVANAAPAFQMPFPCGEVWRADTRPTHSPSFDAIDLNQGSGEDDFNKPVVASAAGTVDLLTTSMSSYGRYIIIDHGGGWSTLYAHLETFKVADGAHVNMGDLIGTVGNNDGALPSHLHYEQRLNGNDQVVVWNGVSIGHPSEVNYTSANCSSSGSSGVRGDWDGDGFTDLVTRDSSGYMHLYRGNGVAFVSGTGGQIGGPGWSGFTAIVRPGDWDKDGKPDLITRDANGYLHLYRGNGASGFVSGTGGQIGGPGWGGFTAIVGPGDWDGDGNVDLIVRTSTGTLKLYRGNGSTGFISGTGGQIGGSGWAPFIDIVGPGDWDKDGKVDLVVRTNTGTIRLYRGNGSAGFVSGTGGQIGGGGWSGFTAVVGPGDWDRDGNVDLVTRASDGTMHLYRGNGVAFVSGTGGQIGGPGWNGFTAIV